MSKNNKPQKQKVKKLYACVYKEEWEHYFEVMAYDEDHAEELAEEMRQDDDGWPKGGGEFVEIKEVQDNK